MTREEAIFKLKDLLIPTTLGSKCIGEFDKPAIEMAIKALEQEPVLDKIRAEIEEKSYLSYDDNPRHIIDESWVIEIIDKYRTEREE